MMNGHWRSRTHTDGTTQPEWFVANDDGTQTAIPDAHTRALAALLVVVGTLDVDDAANAVGVTPNDLVVEAQAWAVAKSRRPDPLQYNVI